MPRTERPGRSRQRPDPGSAEPARRRLESRIERRRDLHEIKNGVAPDFNMVPFKDKLKDDDIWNIVNYIRSIKK